MGKAILQRIGYGIFWIWVVSMLAFFLSKQVPGDPIEQYLSSEQRSVEITFSPHDERTLYAKVAAQRGLDQPYFYFSIRNGLYPDALHAILPETDRIAVRSWIDQRDQGENAIMLHTQLRSILQSACGIKTQQAQHICNEIDKLLKENSIDQVAQTLSRLLPVADSAVKPSLTKANDLALVIVQAPSNRNFILPSIHWNGLENQYHHWMSGLLAQRPLVSFIDGRNAWIKINEALRWTLIINITAFIITMLIGCAIGIWSSLHDRTRRERILNVVLFGLFALPTFWLASLCVLFFSSGEWLSILPTGGLGPYHRATSWIEKWGIISRHLVLPVFCLTVGSIAYLSRQMKQSMMHELAQPYVLAKRAQGLSEKIIVRRHVVRNALFPVITLMGQSIPALLSGSLVIEVIFSIPGMGRLIFTSILARDWPVVFPVLMIVASVTVIMYIIMDLIYAWMDPRVKTAT